MKRILSTITIGTMGFCYQSRIARDCIIFAVISFSDFKEDYGLGDDCPFPFFLPLTKGAINTLWMNRNHFQLKYLTYLAPNSVNQIRQR